MITRICALISEQTTDPQQKYVPDAASQLDDSHKSFITESKEFPEALMGLAKADGKALFTSVFESARFANQGGKLRTANSHKLKVLNFSQEYSTNCFDNIISIGRFLSYRQHDLFYRTWPSYWTIFRATAYQKTGEVLAAENPFQLYIRRTISKVMRLQGI